MAGSACASSRPGGPATSLDLPGLVLASVGLLGIVYGVVRGNDHGWTSATGRYRPATRPAYRMLTPDRTRFSRHRRSGAVPPPS